MAFVVKKRCVLCHKVLDDNGNCTNTACPLSKVDMSKNENGATEKAESEGTNE